MIAVLAISSDILAHDSKTELSIIREQKLCLDFSIRYSPKEKKWRNIYPNGVNDPHRVKKRILQNPFQTQASLQLITEWSQL